MKNGAEIVHWLEAKGYTLTRVGADRLHIVPRPTAPIVERLKLRKKDVLAYLAEMREPLPLEHEYVLWSGAVSAELSVCIRCGVPSWMHGPNALENAVTVNEPNTAVLAAQNIVLEAATDTMLEPEPTR